MLPDNHYEDQLRAVISGRRWICAMDVVVSAARYAQVLGDLGAASTLAIGGSRGAGPIPDDLRTIDLGVTATSMMDGIRSAEAAIDSLPPDVVAAVDAWDPDRSARVLRPLFSHGRPVAGRRCWGGRDPRWVALEDKTVIDAFWDKAGVPRAPSRTVPLRPDALAAAAEALDEGDGTVWVGDNRSGWHGGAYYLRWVRTPAEGADAVRFLRADCDTARVMPFLDGVPCSIHGIVFPDVIVALRPCEMVVLRRPGASGLFYARAGTFWDPPEEDRRDMREIARRVGDCLRRSVDYRGVFTVDGVMTRDGFRPTELNPRFGAAISVMTAELPGLPMYLAHCALVEGEALDWRPADLEETIVSWADANRRGRCGGIAPRSVPEPVAEDLVLDGGAFREAGDGETADAHLIIGPAAAGAFVDVRFVPERTPVGASVAPRAALALMYADQKYDLGIGPLAPAPDVR